MNWLLLRGLIRDKRHWGSFLDKFQESFPDAKLICLDFPGIGTESTRLSPITVAGITDDLRARWLETKKNAGPSYLLSISLGSMVGLDWCARYPEDFKGIVIINSSAKNLSLPWERLNWKIIPALLTSAAQKDPIQREKGIIKLTTHMQKDIDTLAHKWGTFEEDRPKLRATALRQLKAATRFICPTKIAVPGLVLSSLRDRFTSSNCSQALARHLGWQLCAHPLAGHDLPLDDPEWVSEQTSLFAKLL